MKNSYNIRLSERGQTIIELMIAIMVVGLVVISVAVGLTFSVLNTSDVRYRKAATTLSQDAIEFFRNERARLGWQTFSAAVDTAIYCFQDIPADISSLPSPGTCAADDAVNLSEGSFNPGFLREVTLTDTGSQIVVATETKWLKSDGSYRSVILQQNLRDWN